MKPENGEKVVQTRYNHLADNLRVLIVFRSRLGAGVLPASHLLTIQRSKLMTELASGIISPPIIPNVQRINARSSKKMSLFYIWSFFQFFKWTSAHQYAQYQLSRKWHEIREDYLKSWLVQVVWRGCITCAVSMNVPLTVRGEHDRGNYLNSAV